MLSQASDHSFMVLPETPLQLTLRNKNQTRTLFTNVVHQMTEFHGP